MLLVSIAEQTVQKRTIPSQLVATYPEHIQATRGMMMTTEIRLKVPWWTRFVWFEAPRAASNSKAKTAPPATGGDELLALDARTLRDIGAPDSMLARAHARRAAELQERDNLRFGIEAGAGAWWRRW